MNGETKHSMRSALAMILLVVTAVGSVRGAQQSPPMTAPEDHRRILDLLGISSIPPGPSLISSAAFDEATANPYPELPDPFLFKDGRKVTGPEMWKERRVEILEDFDREVYGRIPENAPKVTWEVISADTRGGEIMKRLVGHVDNSAYPDIRVEIQALLIVPVSTQPVPVFLHVVRGGVPPTSTSTSAEAAVPPPAGRALIDAVSSVRIPLGPVDAVLGPGNGAQLVAAAPAADTGLFLQQIQSRGWGYAALLVNSIQQDSGSKLTSGVIGLARKGQPRELDDWGVLSAWAWGASRLFDYLETDRAVDAKQIGIMGNALQGTAALLAMARDERFAIGYVSSSGAGGVKLKRRNFGETVDTLAGPGWYHRLAGNFLKYAGRWNDLPVDSHELIALAAPRPLFIGVGRGIDGGPGGANDAKSDPQGMFMAAVAAGPVYRLLGKADMGTSKFPPIETSLIRGDLAFRQHRGGPVEGPNGPTFLTFADGYIRSVPVTTPIRTTSRTGPQPKTIELTVKTKGNKLSLSGNWEWNGSSVAENGKPYKVTLKVKFAGNRLTGSWSDTDPFVDRVFLYKDLADGEIVTAHTFSFNRCYITGVFDSYQGSWWDEDRTIERNRFKECKRDRAGKLAPNLNVVRYAGRIRGNDLTLTITR